LDEVLVAQQAVDASAGASAKPPRAPRKPKTGDSAAISAKLKSKSGSVSSSAASGASSGATAAAATAATASANKSSCARINKHAFANVSGVRVDGVDGAALHFTLSNAHVSTANALRRIILSEIPTLVFRTFPHEANRATFHVNTSRHHNEILKQRLSCIPIHISDPEFDYKDYYCEINVKNTEEQVIYVTTADFKVKHRGGSSSNSENTELTKKMFPPDPTTGEYIDFARLMPRVSNYSEGEELHVTCDFDMGFAKQDSAFNVCCTCSYGFTPNTEKQDEEWEKRIADEQNSKTGSGSGKGVVVTQADDKKNWKLLDAQRIVVPNSFDFVVETVGVLKNGEILRKACDIMKIKCDAFVKNIENATVANRNIVPADVTIPNAYNIILRNEDYTLGKALEHMLYCKHYLGEQSLVFCAFKKTHPHDEDSYIQVAFETATADMVGSVADIATSAALDVASIFENLKSEHFISL
jgi:DNA-directed RNA polymerase II subunit RPB3